MMTVGVFELSCQTTDHYRGGMRQLYTVKPCTASQVHGSEDFQPDVYFYLAAEEVVWNYAPDRTWELEKHNTTLRDRSGLVRESWTHVKCCAHEMSHIRTQTVYLLFHCFFLLPLSPGNVFLTKSESRIGPEYKKVVYCQYTDDTFTKKKPRGLDEEHLGILGTIITCTQYTV